jgi:ketosteroid isomerase-like protein
MLEPAWARHFAQEWIAAWNARDLDRVLAHYADDFEMRSPLIVQLMGSQDGVLRGKDSVRAYWRKGLEAQPDLHFQLLDVFLGTDTLAIHFRNTARQRETVEVLRFQDGLIVEGAGLYGAPRG